MRRVPTPTKQVISLNQALLKRGIKTALEYWDGYKHIDIAILDVKIYIEIDGLHHYTDSRQIEADLERDYFSNKDDFETIHIPNELIDKHLEKIAEAISRVVTNKFS